MGLHEPESIYSAYKWTSRFFDYCINMLIQTDYKIYKRCRNNHWGNERVMSYAELNESIIYDLLHNNNWRREQLSRVEGRRASERAFDEFSSLSSNSSLQLKETHSIEMNEDRRDSKSIMNTKIFYACKVCGSGGCSGDLTTRAYWHCKEGSMIATREVNRVYLHYQCF